MEKKYTGYTAKQLLNDDFFIQSELHPTDDTLVFWSSLEREDPSLAKEIRKARFFLETFKQNIPVATLPSDEVANLWQQIERRITLERSKVIRRRYWLAAAVAAAACVCLFVFNPFAVEKGIDYQMVMDTLTASNETDDVQLIFSDEERVLIKEKESLIAYAENGEVSVNSTNVRQSAGQKESHVKKKEKTGSVQLNKLVVPAGKRLSLVLADGTKLWVNSSSTVIYPERFAGDKREIYIDGEAYLEVARNPDKPFYVKTEQMNVRVLGTSFNVCAYREDGTQQIVLVSGKVEVETASRQTAVLTPDELFEYDKQHLKTSVTKVDAGNYVSWKDGYYQFVSQQLSVVFKRLSRYYAVPIVWDEKVGEWSCSGKLDFTGHIEDVLGNLKKAAPIQIEHDHEEIIIKYKPKKQSLMDKDKV